MKYAKSNCKHAEKRDATHIICTRDGSYRKVSKGCPCGAYKESWFTKLKKKFTRL